MNSIKYAIRVLPAVFILASMVLITGPAQAVSTNVVISEFRVRGPNGGSDEFIELYNLSTSAVNIGGWLVRGSNASGTVSTRATIPAGVILNPGCHYLLTNSSTSGGPYSGPVPGDQTYATGITDDGGIAITLPDLTIIDQVGMSAGSAFKEGTPLANLGSSNLNRGYERKPGGAAGSGTDTDNNSSDFQLITPSDPQNLASACISIAVPTNPTGVGAANPDPVTAGNSTLLTVTVTPGANPTSTGLAVTGDLSTIGGSAAQLFFDDGSNGDVTAGDNIFSFLAAVPGATTAGAKSLPVTITDAQARSGSTTISLTVQAAAAPVLVINEIDYDQPGTDAAEFIEIRNNDSVTIDLSGITLLLVNGSNGSVYDTIGLPAVSLAPGGYFVVCANAATVANCDLDDGPDTNFIQNGAPDAVALLHNNVIIDTVSYEGDTAAPYTEGSGAGLLDDPSFDNASISRCPDGADTDQNNVDFSLRLSTPGAANACLPAVVINEIDYDQPGTDTAEFIEIRNNDIFSFGLNVFTLELVNGFNGSIYDTISLPAVSLAPGGYFVVCANAATVANCDLDDDPDINFIQNGAPDAAGLRYNGVLIDAVSYEGDTSAPYTEGSGAGLEDDPAFADRGISRCPDGADTDQNNVDFSLRPITPGAANFCFVDVAPTVASTSPANGTLDAAVNTDIVINFSEDVTVTGSWFDISCTSSGAHTAAVSGGPQSYTLNPDVDFVSSESCAVTVFAANVTDQDGTPDNMAADFSFSFTTLDVCTLAFTPAYAIQGSGLAASITGPVTTQGVVVGDYEGPSPTLRGFYLQDLTGDGNPATSDAIFVFNGNNDNVNLGDVVRVSGSAGEFQDQTQISSVSSIANCGTGSVTPVDVTLPVPSATYLEQFEGMLVRFPQTLYVTEHFQLGRFGQVVMSSDGRLSQPTGIAAPGAPALAIQAANNLNRIIIDDPLNNQNPDPIFFGRGGSPLSASNTLRGGDTATGMVGLLTYTWAGNAASGNAYRLRPVGALGGGVPNFVAANPRPVAPDAVGGTLRVSALNLLNYFNTFDGLPDVVDNCNNGVGGAATDCRGADTQTEFDRQWPKTVAAILGTGADVIGIVEIENDGYGPTSAIADLVGKLNAATAPGTYAFIDVDANTGQVNALGTDAIKVGLLYKPAAVTPVGQTGALNTDDFVNGGDNEARNRPSLAQAFQVNSSGAVFIVNVNHLKSKGSPCDDPDALDGQGNCNIVRTNAANALAAWLATDPTGTGDADLLIIGDLNSYALEDPITALSNAGYTNLIASLLGSDAYSFVFDGQWGYLDHALASASLASQVTGVTEYHINADEPSVLDYNTNFKSAGQIISLYSPDQYRASDHDPVIVGLNLNAPPVVDAGGPYSVNEGSSVTVSATGSDPNGDALSYAWDLDNNGSFETAGQSVTFSAAGLDGPSSHVIKVRATDPGGLTAVAQATVSVLNANPSVSASPASQSVQYSDPVANVSITGSDVSADIPLSISTQWKVDSGSFTSGLPAWLSLSTASCGGGTCTWTLSGTALTAPGTYVVRVTVADKDGGSSTADITITVTQEDARATYTGALFAATSSPSSNTAEVTLAATIQDITAVDPSGDPDPGDIRNATVSFVDRDSGNAVLCTATVGLVDPSDPKTGTATCTWTANLGNSNSISPQIGIVVGGYYLRDSTSDDVVVTVSKPLASNFITGGGYIVLTSSGGQIAGDAGSKNNFGFNVKYNRSGRNLQGNINIIVRRTEADGLHVYKIKGNVMTSLAVQPGEGTATFNGKASIQDITDPLAPISVDGNATLQVTMDDNGEPGSSDTIGITLWNKNGGLWFSSNWDGTQTIEQILDGGNLYVR